MSISISPNRRDDVKKTINIGGIISALADTTGRPPILDLAFFSSRRIYREIITARRFTIASTSVAPHSCNDGWKEWWERVCLKTRTRTNTALLANRAVSENRTTKFAILLIGNVFGNDTSEIRRGPILTDKDDDLLV